MDLYTVYSHLISKGKSLPVIKLAWERQIEGFDMKTIPRLSPYMYKNELSMTTEERHALLCRQQKKLEFWGPDVALNIVPAIVVFQNYTPGVTETFNLNIQNISNKSQKVTIVMDEMFPFSIDEGTLQVVKFAPGMSMSVAIRLKPIEDLDYYHKVIVMTEYSTISLPIIGFGCNTRGFVDVPDLIDFGKVPVKYLKTLTFPAANIGKKPARFAILTKGSFCVTPDRGVVSPTDSLLFKVSFHATRALCYIGHIQLKYENGEEIYIRLRAEAINDQIILSQNELTLRDTFMGLTTKSVISLTNGSQFPARFKWKNDKNYDEPIDFGGSGDASFCGPDSLTPMTSKLKKKKPVLLCHKLEELFYHECVTIEPVMGEIRANTTLDFQIFFSPNHSKLYEIIALCDIIGQENRIELSLKGQGLGPKIKFAFDELDIGKVFLNCPHTYEVPVTNTSAIPGCITYIGSVFGSAPESHLCVEPLEIRLSPGEFAAFYIHYVAAGLPTNFLDQLTFIVKSSEEKVLLNIKGTKIHPTLKWSSNEVNFGRVSLGFPKTIELVLTNASVHSIPIRLNINTDGVENVVQHPQIFDFFTRKSFKFPSNPQEFSIEPTEFTISSHGLQRISITLCSNALGNYENRFLIVQTESDSETSEFVTIFELPILALCVIPKMTNMVKILDLGSIYKSYRFDSGFQILNSSDIPVAYQIRPLPDKYTKISSNLFLDVLQPREIKNIPFDLTTETCGHFTAKAQLFLAGSVESQLQLSMEGKACELMLEFNPRNLNFGQVPLLEAVEGHVEITNPSLLNVYFTAQIEDTEFGEEWLVIPEEGTLKGKGKLNLSVKVRLREFGRHSANLGIHVPEMKRNFSIPIEAYGVGTGSALIFIPEMADNSDINFRTIYTRNEKKVIYEIKNEGPYTKHLQWRHERDEPISNPAIRDLLDEIPPNCPGRKSKGHHSQHRSKSSKATGSIGGESKISSISRHTSKKADCQSNGTGNSVKNPRRTIFTIKPNKAIIKPGGSIFVEFKATSKKPLQVAEKFVLWAYTPKPSVESDSKSDLIGSTADLVKPSACPNCDQQNRILCSKHQAYLPIVVKRVNLIANFLTASLKKSRKSIHFSLETSPLDKDFQVREDITMQNTGALPLKVVYSTTAPFSIYIPDEKYPYLAEWSKILGPGEEIILSINFNGNQLRREKGNYKFVGDLNMLYEGNFDGEDYVPLKAEIIFPSLKFDTKSIHFGAIPNGTESIKEIFVENRGNFCLLYKWYIKEHSTRIAVKKSAKIDAEKPQSEVKTEEQSAEQIVQSHNERDEKFIRDLALGNYPKTKAGEDNPDYEEINMEELEKNDKFFELLNEKMYRAKFMEMVGIRDPELGHEDGDELDYLHMNRKEPVTHSRGYAINELIDIVPMGGVVQAGQSQEFNVVFYGVPDIKFSCQAICYVEGGSSRTIEITGESEDVLVLAERQLTQATMDDRKNSKDRDRRSFKGTRGISMSAKLIALNNLSRNVGEPRAYKFGVKNIGPHSFEIQMQHKELKPGHNLEIRPIHAIVHSNEEVLVFFSYKCPVDVEQTDDQNFCLEVNDCSNMTITVDGEQTCPILTVNQAQGVCSPLNILLSPSDGTEEEEDNYENDDDSVASSGSGASLAPTVISHMSGLEAISYTRAEGESESETSEVGSEIFDEVDMNNPDLWASLDNIDDDDDDDASVQTKQSFKFRVTEEIQVVEQTEQYQQQQQQQQQQQSHQSDGTSGNIGPTDQTQS